MPQPIEKIALIVRPESPELASACNEVIAVFERFGVEVCVLESSVASLGLDPRLACKESELGQRAQALVSLGGDGTLISAVRKSLGLDLPVLGINMGRLGFLTAIKPSELEEFVPLLKGGEYVLDLHYLLQGSLEKSAFSKGDSALGNHSADLANFEATADYKSSSASKFAKNYESTTAIPRILGEGNHALCEKSASSSLRDTAPAVAWQSKRSAASLVIHKQHRSKSKNMDSSPNTQNTHSLESTFSHCGQKIQNEDSSSAHFSQAHSQFPSSRADEPLFPSSRASETSVAIHNTNLESSFEKSQKMDCHAAAHAAARNDSKNSPFYVLNEILITKKAISGMTKIYATINNEHFHTYRADGLIIATPTGSSAYNISAGGSLVHPQCRVILLTPVCAHSLTQRPMIVSDDFCLHFSVEEDSVIMLDGQDRIDFRKGDTLIVRGSFPIQLIQHPKRSYFAVLEEKFGLGGKQI